MTNLKREIENKRKAEAYIEKLGVDNLILEKGWRYGSYRVRKRFPYIEHHYNEKTKRFIVTETDMCRELDINIEGIEENLKVELPYWGTNREFYGRVSHVRYNSPKVAGYFKELMDVATEKGIRETTVAKAKNALIDAIGDKVDFERFISNIKYKDFAYRKFIDYKHVVNSEDTETTYLFTVNTDCVVNVTKTVVTTKEYDYKNNLDLVLGEL